MSIRFPSVAFATLGVAVACQPAAESPDQQRARLEAESDSARVAIEALNARFTGFFNAGQTDSVVSLYTSTATVMPPAMPAVTGADSIRGVFATMGSMMPKGSTLALRAQSVVANGPIAVERGSWTMTIPAEAGAPTESHGKYVVMWRKVDGEWRIEEDIWNEDTPPPDTAGQ
jgi:ketosteroid isomerase-like protein